MSVAFQVHKRVEALLNVTKGSRSGLVNVEFEDQSSIAASIWNRIRAKLKIVLTLWQLLAAMEFALDVKFPRLYHEVMTNVGRIVNVSFSKVLPLRCDFKFGLQEQLWFATLWPIVAIGIVWTVHFSSKKVRRRRTIVGDVSLNKEVPHEVPIGFTLGLLYVVFPSASTQIFSCFVCETFDYDSGDQYKNVNAVDYAVSCDSAEYARIRIYAAIFSFVYPAVPLLFFVILFRVRGHLNPLPYTTPEAYSKTVTSFVEREVAASSGVPGRQLLGKLEDTLLLKQQQLRDEFPDITPYQLLYREFEPEFWYWDTVDGVRRLLLSAIIAIFRRGESIQPAFGFFICFIYAALVGSAAPYVDGEDDWCVFCFVP